MQLRMVYALRQRRIPGRSVPASDHPQIPPKSADLRSRSNSVFL